MEAWLLNAIKEGGMFALACVSLWLLNRVWSDRLNEAKCNADAEKAQKEEYRALVTQLQHVIEENTRVIATFIERTRTPSEERKTQPRKQS